MIKQLNAHSASSTVYYYHLLTLLLLLYYKESIFCNNSLDSHRTIYYILKMIIICLLVEIDAHITCISSTEIVISDQTGCIVLTIKLSRTD